MKTKHPSILAACVHYTGSTITSHTVSRGCRTGFPRSFISWKSGRERSYTRVVTLSAVTTSRSAILVGMLIHSSGLVRRVLPPMGKGSRCKHKPLAPPCTRLGNRAEFSVRVRREIQASFEWAGEKDWFARDDFPPAECRRLAFTYRRWLFGPQSKTVQK